MKLHELTAAEKLELARLLRSLPEMVGTEFDYTGNVWGGYDGVCDALTHAVYRRENDGLDRISTGRFNVYDMVCGLRLAFGEPPEGDGDLAAYMFPPYIWVERTMMCYAWAEYLEGVAKGELDEIR